MSCESTNVLTSNTHQATCPGCGGVSGNVTGTHKDTDGPDSHSKYRNDCSPEPAFDGHKIDYEKIEYNEDNKRKDKRCEYNKETHLLEDECIHSMLDYNVLIGQENKTIGKHSNEYPEIGVSIYSGYVMEPASVIRGDNYTMKVPDQMVDIIEAPRHLEHIDKDRKPEGDDRVTS